MYTFTNSCMYVYIIGNYLYKSYYVHNSGYQFRVGRRYPELFN